MLSRSPPDGVGGGNGKLPCTGTHIDHASMGRDDRKWKPYWYWYKYWPALGLATAPYADEHLFHGRGVATNVCFQVPQFRLDDLPFHLMPKFWITGFESLLLQFLQGLDAPL